MRFSGLWAAGLALALAVPGAAHPYDMPQLLAMPLERLLELRITARGAEMLAAHRLPTPADGASHEGNRAP